MTKISLIQNLVNCEVIKYARLFQLGDAICASDWSHSTFTDNYRNINNAISTELMVLDIDDGCTLNKAQELFKDYKHIIATSRSHRKLKNGVICDRYRILLWLTTPINNDNDFKATLWQLCDKYTFLDRQCSDISRLWFKSTEVISINKEGDTIDPILYTPPQASQNALQSTNEGTGIGSLAITTWKFLAEGTLEGKWNTTLYKAAKDCQQNGYTQKWLEEKVISMAPLDSLTFADINTIKSAYAQPSKYEPRISIKPEIVQEKDDDDRLTSLTLLPDVFNYLKDPTAIKGTSTGWPEWDAIIGGWRFHELVVLQAIPKTGKNMLINNIISRLCGQNCKVGMASLELKPDKQVEPLRWSMLLGRLITEKTPTAEEMIQIKDSLENGYAISYFKRRGRPTAQDIVDWMQFEYENYGTNYFFLDHFHKFCANENNPKVISDTIMALTDIKEKLPIFIMVVIQPTKLNINQYGDIQRVGAHTLRGGAALIDDPDILINMHSIYKSTKEIEIGRDFKEVPCTKTYPKDIREIEFQFIRTVPYGDNAGLKVHMQYNKQSTVMECIEWSKKDNNRKVLE